MFFKLQKFVIIAFFIIFLPRDTWGCASAHEGCSLDQLVKHWFPHSTGDPHKELSFRDTYNVQISPIGNLYRQRCLRF